MLLKIFRNALRSGRSATLSEDDVRTLMRSAQFDAARDALQRLGTTDPFLKPCLAAEIDFLSGRDAEAEAGFMAVLADAPGYGSAHYGLSLLLYEKGDLDAALRHAQFALNGSPLEGRFLAQLGLCQLHLGNHSAAEGLLREAVRLLPDDKACWNNLGIVEAAKGNAAAARRCFGQALSLDGGFQSAKDNLRLLDEQVAADERPEVPQHVLAITAQAAAADDVEVEPVPACAWDSMWAEVIALQRAGRAEDAARMTEEMLDIWRDEADVVCKAASLYIAQGDSQGALDILDTFLEKSPDDPRVLLQKGRTLAGLKNLKAAEALIRRAIELGEESVGAYTSLGVILQMQENYRESAEFSEKALALSVGRPIPLLSQVGAAQVMACRYEDAIATYEELFDRTFKDNNPYIGGYALCLTYLGRIDEALKILDGLVARSPNHADVRLHRGQVRLLCGDFAGGWDDYLYRGLSYTKFFRVLPFPRWQGEPLEGKRVVVLAEQGLGDQVMLASCLPDLLQCRPAKVYVEAIYRVAPTLARSFPDCEIIATRQNRDVEWVKQCGPVDYYVPLGDLPARFRRSTESFPQVAYLKADPDRVSYWRARLEALGPGPYLGVSWRGGTQLTRNVMRSLPVEALHGIAKDVSGTWVSLQYGDVQEDLARAHDAGWNLEHWAEAISDLDEFAALITALDGVVTVCNTTVHYAGALGKPTWILAPEVPEWRYGLHWDKLPWYPQAYVFRQSELTDWNGPIMAARNAAQTFFARAADKV